MIKHTKAPWRYEEKDGKLFVASGIPTSGTILANNINSDSMFPPHPAIITIDDEARANARLIASAPELLETLKEVKKQIFAHYKMNVKKDFSLLLADAAAGKAIHKAEG